MARRSYGGPSSSRGISMPARKSAPKPAASAPTSAPARAPVPAMASAKFAPVSNRSSLGASVVEGVGWGVGSSIGHRVTDAIMGSRVIRHENVSSSAVEGSAVSSGMGSLACAAPVKAFQDCLIQNTTDISQCQFLMNRLAECSQSSGSSAFTI